MKGGVKPNSEVGGVRCQETSSNLIPKKKVWTHNEMGGRTPAEVITNKRNPPSNHLLESLSLSTIVGYANHTPTIDKPYRSINIRARPTGQIKDCSSHFLYVFVQP